MVPRTFLPNMGSGGERIVYDNAMSMLVTNKCACCKRSDCHLKVCSRCGLVSYCTKECQKTDWKRGHKAMCN